MIELIVALKLIIAATVFLQNSFHIICTPQNTAERGRNQQNEHRRRKGQIQAPKSPQNASLARRHEFGNGALEGD